ncbi:hypothetical protein GIB67_017827 [Kingdonia uniflora]|uniref:Phytocyanin domain-containing protein n=1 Tax=Kingdonia uniflora TaxID=39325 RepID=A0A7J7MP82_9MAGN|nr:hypothetical protein GIB67_017827 [Kingdonia uniflora]
MLVLCVAAASAQITHVVGGELGWTVPSGSAYATWAATQTFTVGDTLLFNFTTGSHDVVQVKKADFDACTSTNPVGSVIGTGPAKIVLNTKGENFFICNFDSHCSLGQKLAINVTFSSGKATPPSGSGTPPSTTTPPSASGTPPSTTTPPSGSGTPPSTKTPQSSSGPSSAPPPAATGPPKSYAPRLAIASFSLTLLSIIVAFLF